VSPRRAGVLASVVAVVTLCLACSADPAEPPQRSQPTDQADPSNPAQTTGAGSSGTPSAPETWQTEAPAVYRVAWPPQSTTTDAGFPVDDCVPRRLWDDVLSLTTSDGLHLDALELGSGADGVLLAHEQGYNICSWLALGEDLAARGYHVMIFEYRNHGASEASPDNEHIDRDVRPALRVLREHGATRVLMGGASCGGTSSAIVGADLPVLTGLMILSSPARCASLDAVPAVRRITEPSIFVVSPGDMNGAVEEQVRELYAASGAADKELVIDPSGYHGTDLLRMSDGADRLRKRLLQFVDHAFATHG
jgi:pimeloyl-ACP methyl ester carboxylesterase